MENTMNEVQEEICRMEKEEKEDEIFEKFLNSTDYIVRGTLGNNEKADDLIQELTITYLEIHNGIHKEKELSPEDQRRRSKVRESAIREKKHRDYLKDGVEQRLKREADNEFSRKKALGHFDDNKDGDEEESKKELKKETAEEITKRLLRTRTGIKTEAPREIKSE